MIEILKTDVFENWFYSLKDRKAKVVIDIRLSRLLNNNFGDLSPVGEGVSELRINYGPGYRVYLIKKGNTVVILLCGGNKTTQKSDIVKAKLLAKELKNEIN